MLDLFYLLVLNYCFYSFSLIILFLINQRTHSRIRYAEFYYCLHQCEVTRTGILLNSAFHYGRVPIGKPASSSDFIFLISLLINRLRANYQLRDNS